VLHWRSVEVARRFGVRVHVRSSFRKETGTVVTPKDEIEGVEIRGIAHDAGLMEIRVAGSARPADAAVRMLEALDRESIEVRFLYLSSGRDGQGCLSVLVSLDERDSAQRAVSPALPAGEIVFNEDIATISIVGQGIASMKGVARRALASLAEIAIAPDIVSTSGISLTVAVSKSKVAEAVRRLHCDLGLGSPTRDAGQ
jgi:aspartate kinase